MGFRLLYGAARTRGVQDRERWKRMFNVSMGPSLCMLSFIVCPLWRCSLRSFNVKIHCIRTAVYLSLCVIECFSVPQVRDVGQPPSEMCTQTSLCRANHEVCEDWRVRKCRTQEHELLTEHFLFLFREAFKLVAEGRGHHIFVSSHTIFQMLYFSSRQNCIILHYRALYFCDHCMRATYYSVHFCANMTERNEQNFWLSLNWTKGAGNCFENV